MPLVCLDYPGLLAELDLQDHLVKLALLVKLDLRELKGLQEL